MTESVWMKHGRSSWGCWQRMNWEMQSFLCSPTNRWDTITFLNTGTHEKFNVNRFMNIFIHYQSDGMFPNSLGFNLHMYLEKNPCFKWGGLLGKKKQKKTWWLTKPSVCHIQRGQISNVYCGCSQQRATYGWSELPSLQHPHRSCHFLQACSNLLFCCSSVLVKAPASFSTKEGDWSWNTLFSWKLF